MDTKQVIKQKLLEEFSTNPVIQVAVKKVGTSRSAYYRLREDPKFAKAADSALAEGTKMISDMAESQLISAIRDRNITSIIFWLKNRHPAYKERLEIDGKMNLQSETLTPSQEALILRALKLGFGGKDKDEKDTKNR